MSGRVDKVNKREETERRLWKLLRNLKETKTPVGVAEFARLGGVSRAYLYRFHELSAAVAEYAKETQPSKSRRGAGVKVGEAKKRDINEQMRREHARWSDELPQLQQQVERLESELKENSSERQRLIEQRDLFRRFIEFLLLLASEAGVRPQELEAIKEKLNI